MASLQNLWVIVFSFAAVHCFLRPSRGGLRWRAAFVRPGDRVVGQRVFVISGWAADSYRAAPILTSRGPLATTVVCIAAYAYHYDIHSSQAREHASVFATLLDLRPGYSLAFLGNAGALKGAAPSFVGFCIALGLGILVIFVWLARRGYGPRNPAVACCVLFILLTALGIAGVRSDAGMRSSLTSRYTIYGRVTTSSSSGQRLPRNSFSIGRKRSSTTVLILPWYSRRSSLDCVWMSLAIGTSRSAIRSWRWVWRRSSARPRRSPTTCRCRRCTA